MPRIKIKLPDSFVFSTDFQVRLGDINMGGHLGNHILVSLFNETYTRFFREKEVPNELYFGEFMLINTGISVVFKSEGFQGDKLSVELAMGDFERSGFDFFYRATNKKTNAIVAEAHANMVFIKTKDRKVARIPERFLEIFKA